MPGPPSIRDVALIAHVDHGKTTLVDAMLKGVEEARPHLSTSTLEGASRVSSPTSSAGRGVPRGGSTDMGDVSQVVPSIHPIIGIEATGRSIIGELAAATITNSG